MLLVLNMDFLGFNSSLVVNKKVKFQSNVISAVQETLKLHT